MIIATIFFLSIGPKGTRKKGSARVRCNPSMSATMQYYGNDVNNNDACYYRALLRKMPSRVAK